MQDAGGMRSQPPTALLILWVPDPEILPGLQVEYVTFSTALGWDLV